MTRDDLVGADVHVVVTELVGGLILVLSLACAGDLGLSGLELGRLELLLKCQVGNVRILLGKLFFFVAAPWTFG